MTSYERLETLQHLLGLEETKTRPNRDIVESLQYEIAIVLSNMQSHVVASERLGTQNIICTQKTIFEQIRILHFTCDGKSVGWATNTSCGNGRLPYTLEEVFQTGALCFVIALFMNNMLFFQQEKKMSTPCSLISVLQKHIPKEIEHGQLEEKHFQTIARILDVKFSVKIICPTRLQSVLYGSGTLLRPVTLDIKKGHYIVPGIDVPFLPDVPLQKTCPSCTFVNLDKASYCDVCGEGFGNTRPRTLIG